MVYFSGMMQMAETDAPAKKAILIATGLAFGSMILIPGLAVRLGISSTLAGAVRIALMRASYRTLSGKRRQTEEPVSTDICCH